MKAKTVQFHAAGGPEVLKIEQVDLPEPAQGEVTIRHTRLKEKRVFRTMMSNILAK